MIIIVDTIDPNAVSAAENIAAAKPGEVVRLTSEEYERFVDKNYIRILNEGRD